MIFSQVTLEISEKKKKPNGAETNVINPVTLPAKKEKIVQNRLDSFSMQGLKKVVRYSLTNIGEYEFKTFDYFTDENGTRFKRTIWERDPKNNKLILEGEVANGI